MDAEVSVTPEGTGDAVAAEQQSGVAPMETDEPAPAQATATASPSVMSEMSTTTAAKAATTEANMASSESEQMDAAAGSVVAASAASSENLQTPLNIQQHTNIDNLAAAAAAESADTNEANTSGNATTANLEGGTAPLQSEKVVTKPPTGEKPAEVSAAPKPTPPIIDEEDAKWHTVGIFQGLSTTVNNYIDNTAWTSSGLTLTSDNLPDLSKYQRINLEPGTAYRFRIRAINSCGASDWSEVSSFKTCLPGFPGAPSAIKISKSSEGAHLTWEPPPSCMNSNEIVEYSVYLAVKPGKEKESKSGSSQRMPAQLAFVRVYVGAANQCTVAHTSLAAAHVDCSNKPAIIFRIAARNEKGYGPATQVRWLQDPVQGAVANTAGLGSNSSLLSPTRIKPELGGASPSKRFKAAGGGRLMLPPGGDN